MKNNQSSIPFSVIGGFLGAGKTTLLNRLLTDSASPRCAVLVNDFGDIAVDASLIESHGGETISLKNGCICCVMGNDLGHAILKVLDFKILPEHIVVEASGVAHPGRVADVAHISPELIPCGVFVLADAVAICAQLNDQWIADTVDQQLKSAQCILISKLDELLPENQITVINMLSERYSPRPLITTTDMEWTQLLGKVCHYQFPNIPSTTHRHFVTRTIRSTAMIDLHKIKNWIEHSQDIYRIKGWAVDKKDGKTKLIQAVGQRVNISSCDVSIDNQLAAIVIGSTNLPSSETILRTIESTSASPCHSQPVARGTQGNRT